MEKLFIISNTQNEKWGLWGTARGIFDKTTAKKLWTITSMLVHEISGLDSTQTQELLDSHWGKHIVGVFCADIENGTFIKAFRKKMTKERLCGDYNYFVERTKDDDPQTNPYEKFCIELEKLSRKYGIVIQAVDGVCPLTEKFIGYNSDLMPIWKD